MKPRYVECACPKCGGEAVALVLDATHGLEHLGTESEVVWGECGEVHVKIEPNGPYLMVFSFESRHLPAA